MNRQRHFRNSAYFLDAIMLLAHPAILMRLHALLPTFVNPEPISRRALPPSKELCWLCGNQYLRQNWIIARTCVVEDYILCTLGSWIAHNLNHVEESRNFSTRRTRFVGFFLYSRLACVLESHVQHFVRELACSMLGGFSNFFDQNSSVFKTVRIFNLIFGLPGKHNTFGGS
ncbi:hypothetical protein BJ165DRAFT_70241 [Panaeolus papilionaceus]|nr:hypothetical protein BJ165DRAFT_70241 [Panaeolus papilionaceus]